MYLVTSAILLRRDTLPSTTEYPEHPGDDLHVIDDDSSWHFLDEVNKLASNTFFILVS